MHGYGTYVWSDRTTLEISWNFGKPHGKGKLSYGGISCYGVWNNGKRVKWGLQADTGVCNDNGEGGEEELDFKETLFDLEEPHSINFNNYPMRLCKKKPDRKKDEHVKELLKDYQKTKQRRSDPAKKANLKPNSPLLPKKFLSNGH
jgi:MORN repeat.